MCAVTFAFQRVFFAAVLHIVLLRFSEDEGIMANLVHVEEDWQTEPMDRVRKAVWDMLYADDAGVVSKSPEGLTKMMTVIVTVFEEAGLTVSEKKTETMLF